MHSKKTFTSQFYHEGIRFYVGQCSSKEEARELAMKQKKDFVKNPKGHPLYKMNMDATWQHFACQEEMRDRAKVKLSDFAKSEVTLRLAVLEQALVDMKQVSSWVSSAKQIKQSAFDWINEPDTGLPSFTFNEIVEEILGVDPSDARRAILREYYQNNEKDMVA